MSVMMIVTLLPLSVSADGLDPDDIMSLDEYMEGDGESRKGGGPGGGGFGDLSAASTLDWKLFEDYNENNYCQAPSSSGYPSTSDVSVKLNGTAWPYGTTQTASAVKSGTVTVTPPDGWYVRQVVICCDDVGGYHCETNSQNKVTRKNYSIDDYATDPTVTLDLSNSDYWHTGRGSNHHLMIWLEKCPNPVTVKYDSKLTGYTGKAVENGDLFTYNYTTDMPSHTVLPITDALANYAKTIGKRFTGWKLTFYTDADYTSAHTEPVDKEVGDTFTVYTYALLEAQWEDVEYYNVTYVYTGTVPAGAPAAPEDDNSYAEGDSVTVAATPSMDGYTFSGWSVKDDKATISGGKFTMPAENVTLEGSWEANSYDYVIHHVEKGTTTQIADDTTGTADFGDVIDVSEQKKSIEGFTYDSESNDITIAVSGNEATIYYTRNSHTITYKIVGDHFANDSYKVIENVAYGTALSLITDDMTKQGYTWSGWSGLPATMPDADVVVTGRYGNATDTPYKIEYYFETLSGGFNIDNTETLNLFAETNATVKVEAEHKKSFTGFTFDDDNENNILSGTVTADGKLVLKLYYTRNTYTVTYVYETTGITPIGASALPEPATYKYGAEVIVAKKATAPNCNFNGWNVKEGGVAISDGKFTMPANDVVLSGSWGWVVNGTKYTVKHYLETGYAIDKYELDTTEELLGTPGTLTEAKAKSYKGYTAQKFEQQTIAADGKTVVEIYYKLDKADTYTVTYIVDDEIVGKIEEYEAGDTVTVRKRLPDTQLYKFEGWYCPKSISVKNGKFEMPAEDVIIRGHYEYEGIYIPPVTDGYIEVEKILTAPKGYDGATTFTFEIYKDGTDEDDLYAIMKVKAGESEKLKVAVGTYYIYEVGAEEEGYTLTTGCNAKNNRIRVEGGKTRTVTFKNVYVEEILLEKDDHFGYIIGYPDDTVRPESNITRAEIATIFFRMLTDESRAEYWSQTNDFTDVSRSDWFNNAISTLTNAGILSGYADGSFRPNESITRAELVKIAVAFYGSDAAVDADFNDTEDHWADMFINAAYGLGFVNGYEDGSFRPDQAVTRAEAMKIINRTLGRYPTKNGLHEDMIVWSDNRDRSAWYYADVQEATNSHEYVWAADEAEEWTDILPVRDWAALEKSYSDAYDG